MVDVGDLGCRVLNLENESTYTHTNTQTHTLRIPRMSRDPIGSNKVTGISNLVADTDEDD